MIRFLSIAVWLIAVSYMVFRITSGYDHVRFEDFAIAEVVGTRGGVLVMSQDSPSWHRVKNSFYVYNHDLLSTTKKSWAKIKLQNGDTIVVGPQSQVRIQTIAAFPNNMEISLINGSINLERPSVSTTQGAIAFNKPSINSHLQLRFDQYTIAVPTNLEKLAIKKEITSSDTKIMSTSNHFEIRDHLEGVTKSFLPKNVLDKSINITTADLKQKIVPPQILPPNKMSDVKVPQSESIRRDTSKKQFENEQLLALRQWRMLPSDLGLWAMPGLQHTSWAIPFANIAIDLFKELSDFSLRLELKLTSSQGRHLDWVFSNQLPSVLTLNRSDLQKLGILNNGHPTQSLTWDVRIVANAKGYQSVSVLQKYQMQFIQPALGAESVIGFEITDSSPTHRDGIVVRRANSLPLQLLIPRVNDFHQFSPLLAQSNRLLYRQGGRLPTNGIFIVFQNKVTAALSHSVDLDYSRLGKILSADLIFQGNIESFVGSQSISYENFDEKDIQQDLYFVYRDNMLQLDQNLLRTFPVVKEFLVQFNPIFFSKPIKILYSK